MYEDDHVLRLPAFTDEGEGPLDLRAVLEGSLLVDLEVGDGDAERRGRLQLWTERGIRDELLNGLLAATVRPLGGAPGDGQDEDHETERASHRHDNHRRPIVSGQLIFRP